MKIDKRIKQFCPKGHDTFVVGRNKKGICNGCRKPVSIGIRLPKDKRKQFCVNGHDTFICGRDESNACRDCKKDFHERTYIPHPRNKKKFCIRGHEIAIIGRDQNGNCNQCTKDRSNEWYVENLELAKKYRKLYYVNNKEMIVAINKQYYEENKEKIIKRSKKYQREHPEIHNAATIKNQTNRSLCVVMWTDWDEIKIIDKNKPKSMTLDHIIPLQNPLVWGLHVSWNLQYLTRSKNSSKNNKCNLIEASEWYGQILQQAGLK